MQWSSPPTLSFWRDAVKRGALVCALAIAGPLAAQGQIAPPVFGTPGLPGTEVRGVPAIATRGSNRRFSQIIVRLELQGSCQMNALPGQDVSVRCSQDTPFVAVLLSDADPAFEQTLAFSVSADEWRPTDALIPVSAQRLVVDY